MFSLDPFARVAFLNYSQVTERISRTLNPTWDQTLIIDTIDVYGEPRDVALIPPPIVVEVFDYDPIVCFVFVWFYVSGFLSVPSGDHFQHLLTHR